jgi:hypothetical protein
MKTDKKKSRAIASAAFVNRDQVLGGGCNCEIADIKRISQVFRSFKTYDKLEIYGISYRLKITRLQGSFTAFNEKVTLHV